MKFLLFILFTFVMSAQNADWLEYDQTAFDSDTCCWRKLSKEREFEKSANLIVQYIKRGKFENKQSLNWHAGQMFAFSSDDRQALKYFRKTFNFTQKWFGGHDGKTWFYFAKGTSAFINRQKDVLQKIITRWKTKLPIDENFHELVQLLENWDMNYENATKNATSGNTR